MKKELNSYKSKIEEAICKYRNSPMSQASLSTMHSLLKCWNEADTALAKFTDDNTLNYQQINKWVHGMTGGEHYTMAEASELLDKYNLDLDALLFYAAINAQYSDYHEVYAKYGCDSDEFYVHTAVAFWFEDKDAVKDKLAVYYNTITM